MDPQTIFLPAKPRVRRKRRGAPAPARPVVALTLVAASFDEVNVTLTLSFDRAIDVAGLDGAVVIVEDAVLTGRRWAATGEATMLTPASVVVGLVDLGPFADPYITQLNAAADNGIVAVDDGGAWAGCSEQELPVP